MAQLMIIIPPPVSNLNTFYFYDQEEKEEEEVILLLLVLIDGYNEAEMAIAKMSLLHVQVSDPNGLVVFYVFRNK